MLARGTRALTITLPVLPKGSWPSTLPRLLEISPMIVPVNSSGISIHGEPQLNVEEDDLDDDFENSVPEKKKEAEKGVGSGITAGAIVSLTNFFLNVVSYVTIWSILMIVSLLLMYIM